MTRAMAIFTHALRMLVFDAGTTLRVLLPALALVLGSAIIGAMLAPEALALFYDPSAPDSLPEPSMLPDPASVSALLVLGLVGLLGYALLAILWHRHVLLNGPERDGIRPGTGVVLGYIWRAILVGLVQFLVAIPIGLVLALMGGAAGAGGLSPTLVLAGVLAGILFLWVALRLGVVLPAAALGITMPLAEGWRVTAPLANTLWGVAALLAVLNALISLGAGLLLPAAPGVRLVVESAIYLAEGLVFISVLTTLYGHLVEGRPLDAASTGV
jgi:hypothetical protein